MVSVVIKLYRKKGTDESFTEVDGNGCLGETERWIRLEWSRGTRNNEYAHPSEIAQFDKYSTEAVETPGDTERSVSRPGILSAIINIRLVIILQFHQGSGD